MGPGGERILLRDQLSHGVTEGLKPDRRGSTSNGRPCPLPRARRPAAAHQRWAAAHPPRWPPQRPRSTAVSGYSAVIPEHLSIHRPPPRSSSQFLLLLRLCGPEGKTHSLYGTKARVRQCSIQTHRERTWIFNTKLNIVVRTDRLKCFAKWSVTAESW